MASLVLDSSIAAAWCFPDEETLYTKGVLQFVAAPSEAVAPRLWAYEIRNSVLLGVRRKRITQDHAEDFLDTLNSLPIRLADPSSLRRSFRTGRPLCAHRL
jgi:predicted nucleic acid-binding protein